MLDHLPDGTHAIDTFWHFDPRWAVTVDAPDRLCAMDADGHVAPAQPFAQQPHGDAGDERHPDHPEERGYPDQAGGGRAGEAHVGEGVTGEGLGAPQRGAERGQPRQS